MAKNGNEELTATCASCRFGALTPDPSAIGTEVLVCRRYPPTVQGAAVPAAHSKVSIMTMVFWPGVKAGDWCGEYETTPVPATA